MTTFKITKSMKKL